MCANGSRSHISGGIVERVVIAGNAPLPNFKADGPPMPDEGLSIDIETSGTTLRPLATLPAIRDADLTVRITGGTANVSLGRGTVEVAPGRKLNIASGVFEVPDTHLKPAPARARFRIDGSDAGGGRAAGQRRAARQMSASRSIRRRAAARSPPRSRSIC